MNFKELIYEWLNENHKDKIKERTYLRYINCINYLIPLLGDYNLIDITPRLLQSKLNEIKIMKSRKTHLNLSNSTFNSIITIVKMVFEYAIDFEIINFNPTNKLKRLPIEKHQSQAFSKLEQTKIQNYIDNKHDDEYFPITLCFYTGLRIGELLALEWSDINLKTGILNINKTYYRTKINGKWILKYGSTKSESSNRIIPLPFFIIEELRRIKKTHKSKYLCIRNDGTRMEDRFLRNRFNSILKKLHIKHLNFHCIRHTFATRALENRFDIKTLSEILGHSNVATTLNIYAHSLIEHKRSQMRKLKKLC